MELPPEIANPLIALGVLLLIVGVVAVVGYASMQYHALRGHGSVQQSPNGHPRNVDGRGIGVHPSQQLQHPTVTPPIEQPASDRFAPVAFGRVLALTPKQRQAVMVVTLPGGGKTFLMNALLVMDIGRRNCQVIVLNPHFTYYHAEDQPIDLRPLQDRFEVHWSYAAIRAALEHLVAIVEERKPRYAAGESVGHDIVVYIDEWPAIAESEVAAECIQLVRKLVREARKYKVFLVLASQDALTNTLKLSSGVRVAFPTRFVGTADKTTWRELAGDVPQRRFSTGEWLICGPLNGVVRVEPPPMSTIAQIARLTPPAYPHLLMAPTAEDRAPADDDIAAVGSADAEARTNGGPRALPLAEELAAMRVWLQERDAQGRELSGRELARRLYRLRGGPNPEYDGSGPVNREAKELAEIARQLLEQQSV